MQKAVAKQNTAHKTTTMLNKELCIQNAMKFRNANTLMTILFKNRHVVIMFIDFNLLSKYTSLDKQFMIEGAAISGPPKGVLRAELSITITRVYTGIYRNQSNTTIILYTYKLKILSPTWRLVPV
jgi:hypothetical protein